VLAVFAVLLLVTLVPPLLLWLANTGLADDSLAYAKDHTDRLLQIVASGGILALFNASLGLAVAAGTERRAYAAGTLLGGSLLVSTVTDIVRGTVSAGWGKYAALLDPIGLPIRTMRWIFGLQPEPNISGWLYLAATGAVVLLCAAAVLRVYRRVSF
jgi:hypothetical protein